MAGGEAARSVACVVGTRPEAIKMAPVIARLGAVEGLRVRVISTGQHRGLLDQALRAFRIEVDRDLDLMRADQSPSGVLAGALVGLETAFKAEPPDLVLAQGDTTTVLASALAAYHARVPFGHVEAGLRTGHPYRPFPEEKNRQVVGQLATIHFAPTGRGRANLVREGVDPSTIRVTGNTSIDALRWAAGQPEGPPEPAEGAGRMVLVTAHRRENFGAPLEEICAAVRSMALDRPDLRFVFPVHPNPSVRGAVDRLLGGVPRVRLVEPAGYFAFVALMKQSTLILTDSGGVQEEGPSLGKPILVLRDETERPEAVEAGAVKLVGPHRDRIVAEAGRLLDDPDAYRAASAAVNPYGDGLAAERIARAICRRFDLDPGPEPPDFRPEWA